MQVMTQSGTVYTVYKDVYGRNMFVGGRFKTPVEYVNASLIIGTRGRVVLVDGRIVNTSIIVCYR